ncbi:MAG: relaxase/mobilization nuclease domain-containing protein [Adhaeribacter sp.]
MIGKSFGGCVRYNVLKPEALILHADGVRIDSVQSIINDFNLQRKLNPNLEKAVGHIALNWSIHDKDKLSPGIMVDRAREYMEKMEIRDTQYLIVQHQDRQHPHIHIIYNRVDYQGKTISDRFQKQRNARVCKDLTIKHGYYLAPGKAQVNRQQLKGADKARYGLYDTISAAVRQASNWTELSTSLERQGISTHFKLKGGTTDVQGVSFRKGEIHLKGSQIDRGLSYGNITRRLELNRQQSLHTGSRIGFTQSTMANRNTLVPNIPATHETGYNLFKLANNALGGIFDPEPANDMDEYSNLANKRKRRKNKRRHL